MKKRIAIMIAAILLVLMIPTAVSAASASVSIKGAKAAEVGETLTVTVTYKGDALGYVNGQLTYDNSKLEYLSGGSSQGDAGLVELKNYASDASGKLSFKVKFKAVGEGSVNLSLETLETQNLDGDQSMGTPSASSSLSIAAAQTQETESTTEETTDEETDVAQQTATSGAAAESTPETDVSAAEDGQNAGGVNYVIVGAVAAVLLILIAIIAIALKRKGKK